MLDRIGGLMDDALVRQAARGDADAFDELARDRIDRLLAIAYRILRHHHDAEDAVQQTLWTAWAELPGLRDPARFDAWLYRMLVRMCYRAGRSRQRRTSVVHLVSEVPEVADEQRTDRIADREALERAFATLSTEHRAVIVLQLYVGLGLHEIAEILEIPYGTVRSRAHYATHRLRTALTTAGDVPSVSARRAAR